jgi:uncharacterized membrane protein YtjA (UPF0391 family)
MLAGRAIDLVTPVFFFKGDSATAARTACGLFHVAVLSFLATAPTDA